MKCSALIITIVSISLMGCASLGGRPEEVNGLDLNQQLENMIDDYVKQVLDQCIEIHGKYNAGETSVNCAYWGDLSAMHLSLPDVAYHNRHYQSISQLRHNWCAAAQSKTGKPARWVRHFREENQKIDHSC
jgi:hypothetical protein